MPHKVERILLNKVKCLVCEQELVSEYRHDYKTCDCANGTMVDGGTEYLRRGGKDLKLIQELSEHIDVIVPCSPGYDGKCWRCEMEAKRND